MAETPAPTRYGLFDWMTFVCFATVMFVSVLQMTADLVGVIGFDGDRGFAMFFAGALGLVVGRLLKPRGDDHG